MTNDRGFLGKLFDNDAILWFIILFLLLFWGLGSFREDRDIDALDKGLTID
jgi:hypothetical protein